MRRSFVRTITGVLAFLVPAAGWADFYLHVWENHYQREKTLVLSPEVQQFSTSSNFSDVGDKSLPVGFTSLSRTQVDVNVRYGLLSWLSGYGRLSWTRQLVDGDVTTNTSLGTVYGFPDQTVGLNARILRGKVMVDLQGQVDFPLYSNAPLAATSTSSSATSTTLALPNLGDGTIDFSGGGFITWPFYRLKNHAFTAVGGGGLTYRTAGFSMAIPWSAVLRVDPYREGFKALVGMYGFQSLLTDTAVDPLAISCVGAGGSCISNAVNPSGMYLRLQAGYQFDPRMNVTIAYASPLAGKVIPDSTAFIATFQMGFDFGSKKGKTGANGKPLSSEPTRSKPGFVNYALEGQVKKINDRMGLLKIDKGTQDGVEEGQTFDVFTPAKGGKMEAVAKATCVNVAGDEATLKIVEYYKEVWIEEGFIVKRPLE